MTIKRNYGGEKIGKKKGENQYIIAIALATMIYLMSVLGASVLLQFEVDGNNLIFGLVAVTISASTWAFVKNKS